MSISVAYLGGAASLLRYLTSIWIQGRHDHNPRPVNQLKKAGGNSTESTISGLRFLYTSFTLLLS